MYQEDTSQFPSKNTEICGTCNKIRKPKSIGGNESVQKEKEAQPYEECSITKENLTTSLSSKFQSFKQKFDTNKSIGSSTESLEKKGLLQRMHSLSLLKSKEKLNSPTNQEIAECVCDDSDMRFHTWPERGKDRLKSPKKKPPEPPAEAISNVPVDMFLQQLPLAYDPITKQLRLIQPKAEQPKAEQPKEEEYVREVMGHKRQSSLLSTVSSNGSEAHIPLMPLCSHPHSSTSLSSLSNYSSSTDFTDRTNSLERSSEPPRFGISSFWQRAFARKTESDNASWKLFSRSSLFQRSRSGRGSCSSLNSGTSPASTPRNIGSTGLILESRPSHLPAKCPAEEQHHQLLYQKLLEESHHREQIKSQEAEKRQEQLSKQEEQVAAAGRIWATEILPQWETARKLRKTRELWWQGLPPSVRGQVWKLSIGNDLNVTPELFALCLERAKEKINKSGGVGLESSVDSIKLDLSRTFPHLGFFQLGGPYHQALGDILSAYVCFRPDIGYVQGMSFLAATLLLNLDVNEAFITFANLLNRPLFNAFFRLDHSKMDEFYTTFESMLKSQLPRIHSHFQALNLTSDLYLQEWIYTLYSRSLPLDLASRVWDAYCRDGDDIVFRTAIGILKLHETSLLESDFIFAAQLLTNLPEDIDGIKLFKLIEQISACQEKSRFSQILTHHFKVKGHN